MSKGAPAPPRLDVRPGGELALDGPAFREILRDALRRGLSVRFRAGGTSMTPFIRDGDVLTVVPRAAAAPTLGDVVVFVPPGRIGIAVHRIVRVTSAGCVVKGDNLTESDGCIPIDEILGVVSRVERRGRTVRSGVVRGKAIASALSRLRYVLPGAVRAALRVRNFARRRRP